MCVGLFLDDENTPWQIQLQIHIEPRIACETGATLQEWSEMVSNDNNEEWSEYSHLKESKWFPMHPSSVGLYLLCIGVGVGVGWVV